MPWTISDVDRFNKGLSRKQKRKWVAIANSSLKQCIAKGGSDETCAPKAIQIANGVIKREKEKTAMMTLSEVVKKVGGKSYPASSFLVVGDSEDISTWHLPVKTPAGKPDHRLMGAAWAALHKGFRGNQYQGPDKEAAIRKLKALYSSEELTAPAEDYQPENEPELAEYDDEMPMYIPSTVIAFDQLDALKQTAEMSEELRELTGAYIQLVNNVIYWYEGDKVAQLRTISGEFADRIQQILSDETESGMNTESNVSTIEVEKLSESVGEDAITIEEGDLKEIDNVLHLNVAIIRPGWGNRVDNHYYPSEMLQNCAENFNGAKMYETDHRQEEKSTRTWVSTITEIKGFADDGAPVARVAIHDPGFAERVRNLARVGLLSKLECSIFANGTAEPNFELGGRKGKKVIAITEVESVDWVTRAGAGGRALELTENDKGGGVMNEDIQATEIPVEQPDPVAETEKNTVPVTVNEAETSGSETQEPTTQIEANTETTQTYLTEAEVCSLLETSKLNPATQARLQGRQYESIADLEHAIEDERVYLAAVLEAGKVFGMGEVERKPVVTTEMQEARNSAADRVNQRYFGGLK